MSELARLSFESAGDVKLARLTGEVDASNVSELGERLLSEVSNEARALILDLSETRYIDSSGISLIFDAAARLRNRRQGIRLVVVPNSFVAQVLATVSIGEAVPIDPAMADALSALNAG